MPAIRFRLHGMATHPTLIPTREAIAACCCVGVRSAVEGPLAQQLRSMLVELPEVYEAGSFQGSACAAVPAQPDIVLQTFDGAHFDADLRDMALRQAADPAPLRTLAVTSGLSAPQLAALAEAGVDDFVCVPLSAHELWARIRRLLPAPTLSPDGAPGEPRPHHVALRGLLGCNPAFLRLVERLPQMARYDVGALLLGETGTGKEALAQALHYLSPRAKGPWVAVNCAAIPLELLEAELFGHVKGAYTHASQSRHGLIHEAEGGTLFLDEIDSLPYEAQAKLLRFLQAKQYRPVGANGLVTADVRVVAASNRDLDALAAQGGFRQDLLFRLNVLQLRLPPLRERMEDVPLLARHFLATAARTWSLPARHIAPAALQLLQRHAWPGNVRELKNVVERAVLMSSAETLQAADIDLGGLRAEGAAASLQSDESFHAAKARVVASFECDYIQQLLTACGGNVTQAARAAKKNRRAFFELMRKHNIQPEPFRGSSPRF